jgi:hypothetical protein
MSPIPICGGVAIGWVGGGVEGAVLGALLAILVLTIGAVIAYAIVTRTGG